MEASDNRTVVAITGANGFIGKHLVNSLSKDKNLSLRLLTRSLIHGNESLSNVKYIQGDLTKVETLHDFLVPGCTVINLAYNFDATREQNIAAIHNLIDVCQNSRINRLIHCSTAAVYGRAKSNSVDELSECNPRSNYGKTKLLIEQELLSSSNNRYEYVNVRPTAVYGPEGQALMKLISNLLNGNGLANYLRACLFNDRTMNLVHITNVVGAILFLIHSGKNVDRETYIVSEDYDSNNTYSYIESYLLSRLTKRPYLIPRVPLPPVFLSLLLRAMGRDLINPKMTYSTKKLQSIGFKYITSLESGLDELCDWYKRGNNTRNSGGA